MALLNIFDIAGSALTAQSQRLNVAASNLATVIASPVPMDSHIGQNRWYSRLTLRQVLRQAA